MAANCFPVSANSRSMFSYKTALAVLMFGEESTGTGKKRLLKS
jgi:hypothetical protein